MARICVIRQGLYPTDQRLRREVDALLDDGHEVDVFCAADEGEPIRERHDRLTVRRIRLRVGSSAGIASYLLKYLSFLLLSAAFVGLLHLRRRYDLVQVNSIPDTLVFAAIIPKLTGASVVLDLHECMPEFFSTRFRRSMSHPMVRLITMAEQASIRFADHVITCTEQMREAFISRGAPPWKIQVVLNGADEQTFRPRPELERTNGDQDEFVLISHGTIEERYGIDTVIRAVALLKDEIPGLRLHVYGRGSITGDLRQLTKDLDVEDHVWISRTFVPLKDLLNAIASANAGVVAMKRDSFRDLTLCNKMYELISMQKPIIVSRTRSVTEYYDESCFMMFDSGDEHDLARAIRELVANPEIGNRLVEKASEVNEPYRWPYQKIVYLQVIAQGLREGPSPHESTRAQGGRHAA